MFKPIEGSHAIAEAVALCRPQVVAAYPITPQTHIVEHLSKLVAQGKLKTEFVSVESEFSAASLSLGAVMAGSRTFTATSSQGLLLMSEVLFDIAGMRVPLVLLCANRAISAPLNIWNDQQDSMSQRDAGWIQIYCESNQEAVETVVQAYRIAERCELPVMVCVDGFVLTHTLEGVDLPTSAQVDGYLPPFDFGRKLDSAQPISAGMLVTPDFYTECRASLHEDLMASLDEIEQAASDWAAISGRFFGGAIEVSGEGEIAGEIAILAIGSVVGTLREALHQGGQPVKLLKLRCFRPFPTAALLTALAGVKKLIVVERALSPGAGGIVGKEVQAALYGQPGSPAIYNVAIGLGGRDIPLTILDSLLALLDGPPLPFAILDLHPEKMP